MLRQSTETKTRAPATHYLALVAARIAAIREDVPRLIAMGQEMAELLLAGGQLFTSDIAPFWPSEFGGRAGGFMGISNGPKLHESAANVAYFALPDPRKWDAGKDAKLGELLGGKAKLFVIGREQDVKSLGAGARFSGFTGGANPDDGLYGFGSRRPLASVREFEQFVRGWITAGELTAACTRAGKMPTIWMSVWLEGAMVRNAQFFDHDNRHEPWHVPFFHPRHYVPPLPAGQVANAFLDEAERIHRRLVEQSETLATAGQWLADAKRRGQRLWAVAVGHSYPAILDLPGKSDYPLEWGHSQSDLTKAIPPDLGKDDVALHLGYSPVDNADVKTILNRGIRLIHTSPYGPPLEPLIHKNFLFFDLLWRPADATVDVPGYSVRILPMSSTAQTMALFAILAEMAHNMGW